MISIFIKLLCEIYCNSISLKTAESTKKRTLDLAPIARLEMPNSWL